ncbi:MAG: hypothetical protein WDO68_14350 [Gammaproteobacteria bacterium]
MSSATTCARRVAALQLAGDSAGARAEIDDGVGRELEEVQPLEQLVADARLQDRGLLVRAARAIEGSAYADIVQP